MLSGTPGEPIPSLLPDNPYIRAEWPKVHPTAEKLERRDSVSVLLETGRAKSASVGVFSTGPSTPTGRESPPIVLDVQQQQQQLQQRPEHPLISLTPRVCAGCGGLEPIEEYVNEPTTPPALTPFNPSDLQDSDTPASPLSDYEAPPKPFPPNLPTTSDSDSDSDEPNPTLPKRDKHLPPCPTAAAKYRAQYPDGYPSRKKRKAEVKRVMKRMMVAMKRRKLFSGSELSEISAASTSEEEKEGEESADPITPIAEDPSPLLLSVPVGRMGPIVKKRRGRPPKKRPNQPSTLPLFTSHAPDPFADPIPPHLAQRMTTSMVEESVLPKRRSRKRRKVVESSGSSGDESEAAVKKTRVLMKRRAVRDRIVYKELSESEEQESEEEEDEEEEEDGEEDDAFDADDDSDESIRWADETVLAAAEAEMLQKYGKKGRGRPSKVEVEDRRQVILRLMSEQSEEVKEQRRILRREEKRRIRKEERRRQRKEERKKRKRGSDREMRLRLRQSVRGEAEENDVKPGLVESAAAPAVFNPPLLNADGSLRKRRGRPPKYPRPDASQLASSIPLTTLPRGTSPIPQTTTTSPSPHAPNPITTDPMDIDTPPSPTNSADPPIPTTEPGPSSENVVGNFVDISTQPTSNPKPDDVPSETPPEMYGTPSSSFSGGEGGNANGGVHDEGSAEGLEGRRLESPVREGGQEFPDFEVTLSDGDGKMDGSGGRSESPARKSGGEEFPDFEVVISDVGSEPGTDGDDAKGPPALVTQDKKLASISDDWDELTLMDLDDADLKQILADEDELGL
ncbi:hypothetical protein HDV05_000098 [Chytridiales sp. JEL 0842]|nr:hypothetical protein HDV05_000098 [Chytridiales sp. JEL 0842]